MIFTIVGKPGGGKSLYSLRHVVKVLTGTQNSVCTNLSIRLPDLQAYLDKHYPALDIDVNKRVRLLDEKQARRFWLYRLDANGSDVDLEAVTRDQEKAGINVDYSKITKANREALDANLPRVYPGICYVIDECHVFFDSRAWAESGLSLTFYNSQHRKLDDDVLFVTQFLELIDKRVKGFSQEFVYLRNNGAEKIFTPFRGPSYFSAKHYQRPPSGLQDVPSEVHRFGLDIELANCYDTSAGVGISGVGKPEAKKKSGIHIAWAMIPVLVGCYLLWAAPDWAAKAALGTDVGARSAQSLGLVSSPAPSPGQAVEPSSPVLSSSVSQSLPSQPGQPLQTPDLYPTGYSLDSNRGRITIFMSDGTTRTERDSELTRLERNFVILDGRKLYFRSTPRPPVLPPSPAPPPPPPVTPSGPPPAADEWDANTGPIGRPSPEIGRPSGQIGRSSRR